MKTALTALTAYAACTAARSRPERPGPRKTELLGGRVRLHALWNEGAAFGLPLPPEALPLASAGALALVWTRRARSPLGAGLVLGGGLSNLTERLQTGKVYDYIQFPQAPLGLKRYVFNLADLAILTGAACLAVSKEKRRR